jgi:phage-related minor tail protein
VAGDAVWLDVLPAMAGFSRDLTAGATRAATDAGRSSGSAWSRAFAATASDGGAQKVVDDLKVAQKATEKIVDQQVQAISRARASERDATAKVLLAEQSLADARQKYGADSARVEAAELRLAAARERQSGASARLVSVEDQLVAAQREHRAVTEQLERATTDLNAQVDQQPTRWGAVRASLSNAKTAFSEATGGVGGMITKLAALTGGVALFTAAWSNAMELDQGIDTVTAALDLTATQSQIAGDVAGSLYADAYGESLSEVSSATGTVMSSIAEMREASSADLEKVTGSALAFADVFGVDVAESSRNAGILIKTGLATDAIGAFDLMTAALQKVPEALRGEVVDATQEYSQYFATLGLTGEQSMGLLVAASEHGQYAIDKTGDALKELTIRSTDMSKSSVSAYEAAGLSAEDMAARFLAGGESAGGALSDLVAGLQGIEDPTLRANSAIALFGTPLEDIGVDKIPAFLDSLNGMNTGLGDVSGKASAMADTLQGNTATGLESVKRGFMGVISDGIEPFLEPAEQILDWASENPKLIQWVVLTLGALSVAMAVATVSIWAMNTALWANPITWIVAAVIAGIAAIAAAFIYWDEIVAWLKDIWEPIGDWFSGIWDGIVSIANGAMTWFEENLVPVFTAIWDGIVSIANGAMTWFEENLVPVFTAIWGGITAAADVAWTILQVIFVSIATAWSLLGQGLMFVWDTLLKPVWDFVWLGAQVMWHYIDLYVFQPFKLGWELLGAGFAWVKDNVLAPAWAGLQTLFKAGWDWIDQWVIQPFKLGWELLGAGFAWVKDNVIDPAWAGVKSLLSAGWNWIDTNVLAPLRAGVGAIGETFEATKTVIETAWDQIKAAAAGPVNFVIETVYTNGIKKTWDSIAEKVGLDLRLPVVKPIAFADGGEHHTAQIAPAGAWRVWAEPETGGEAYIPLAQAKRGRSTSILANVAARFGYDLQPMADGGLWGNISGWAGDTWDKVASGASAAWDWTKNAAAATANFLKDPAGAMLNLITRPVDALLEKIGAGDFGRVVAEMPRRAVTGLVETVKGLVSRKNETVAPDGTGVGVTAMSAMAKALMPTVRITSGYRPGAKTAGFGNASMHSMGRAIDLAGGPGLSLSTIWDTLNAAHGRNSQELLYTPKGANQILRGGRRGNTSGVTATNHLNHVHWALADGAVIPRQLFDTGGVLQPGTTLVENRTGKPELVLNPEQIQAAFAGRKSGGNRYLTVKNYDRPVTAQTLVAASQQLDLLTPQD